jgi:hypothetical protein
MVINDVRRLSRTDGPESREARPDEMYCTSCGSIIRREASICVSCGVATRRSTYTGGAAGSGESKNKAIAIVLAIFFGHWAWLYTYREDASKFWINTAVHAGSFVLTILTLGIFALVWLPIIFASWIWAIVDTLSKSDDWYVGY